MLLKGKAQELSKSTGLSGGGRKKTEGAVLPLPPEMEYAIDFLPPGTVGRGTEVYQRILLPLREKTLYLSKSNDFNKQKSDDYSLC